MTSPRTVEYRAEIFDTPDLMSAKAIVLQPEPGMDTNARWARETGFLADWMTASLKLAPTSLVVDLGCGVGRLSKMIIDHFGVCVLGVDISAPMRAMATDYVGSPNISAVSSDMFNGMLRAGMRADMAVAAWVLQHVLELQAEIDRIWLSLKPNGLFIVLNMHTRCVPTTVGWVDDRQDVHSLLTSRFEFLVNVPIPASASAPELLGSKFLRVYRKTKEI